MTPPNSSPTYNPQTLLAIDFSNIIYRNYHALKAQGRTFNAPDGTPTGSLMLSLSKIFQAIELIKPAHTVAVFEGGGKGVRQEIFEGYKQDRAPSPDEIKIQTRMAYKVLPLLGVSALFKDGQEADDVLLGLGKKVQSEHQQPGNLYDRLIMLTGDKDMYYALDDTSVWILPPDFKDMTLHGVADCQKRLGVHPKLVPQYLALMGDSVDGIPGVENIGTKTAAGLLNQFGSLDAAIDAVLAGTFTGRGSKELKEQHEKARLSLRLAMPIVQDIDVLPSYIKPNWQRAYDELAALGFKSFLGTIKKYASADGVKIAPTDPAFVPALARIGKKSPVSSTPSTPSATEATVATVAVDSVSVSMPAVSVPSATPASSPSETVAPQAPSKVPPVIPSTLNDESSSNPFEGENPFALSGAAPSVPAQGKPGSLAVPQAPKSQVEQSAPEVSNPSTSVPISAPTKGFQYTLDMDLPIPPTPPTAPKAPKP